MLNIYLSSERHSNLTGEFSLGIVGTFVQNYTCYVCLVFCLPERWARGGVNKPSFSFIALTLPNLAFLIFLTFACYLVHSLI